MASSFFAHDDSHLVTLSNGQSDTENPATKPETRIDTGNEAGSDVSHYESIELSGMQEMLREFQKQMYTADQPGSAILIGVYVPLFVSSIVGNVLVLVLVLPFRRMRNVTHCFIVNLAVSDLLLTIVCVPTAVGQSVYKVWLYGKLLCKVTAFMQGVTVSSSVFTIAILSADRLLAIRLPMSFRIYRAGRHAWVIVALVWVASIGVASPLLAVRQLETIELPTIEPVVFCHEVVTLIDYDVICGRLVEITRTHRSSVPKTAICSRSFSISDGCPGMWSTVWHRRVYDITLFILLFAIPGLFIIISYALIGHQLWVEDVLLHGRKKSPESNRILVRSRQTRKILSGRRRLARMLGAIAAAFAICWMPYQLLSLYIDFLSQSDESPAKKMALEALPFTILLGHSNSVFNPVLYCVMNYRLHRQRQPKQLIAPAGAAAVVTAAAGVGDELGRQGVVHPDVDIGDSVNKQSFCLNGVHTKSNHKTLRRKGSLDYQITRNVNSCDMPTRSTSTHSLTNSRSMNTAMTSSQITASISGNEASCGSRYGRILLRRNSRRRSSSKTTGTAEINEPKSEQHTKQTSSNESRSTKLPTFLPFSATAPRRTSPGTPSFVAIEWRGKDFASSPLLFSRTPATSSAALTSTVSERITLDGGNSAGGGGRGRVSIDMMFNIELDIPTTINEESSGRSCGGSGYGTVG